MGHLETGDLWLNSGIFILPENTYHQVKKNVLQKRFLKMQMVVLEENMTFKKRIIKRHLLNKYTTKSIHYHHYQQGVVRQT